MVPGQLIVRLVYGVRVEQTCCLSSTTLFVCPHFLKSFSVFGLGFGLSEGGPLPSGVGGVSSKAAASIFVPSTAVPSRPPRSFWISQIYRPSVSLSRRHLANDEARFFLCSATLPPAPALPQKPFSFFGGVFGLSEGGPLPSGVSGVSSKAEASIFVPSIAVPSRPSRSFWFYQIYRPSVSLSLSLVPTSPMRRRMHSIMATPARRARVHH